jgi:undecaprenyl-diphosphatase
VTVLVVWAAAALAAAAVTAVTVLRSPKADPASPTLPPESVGDTVQRHPSLAQSLAHRVRGFWSADVTTGAALGAAATVLVIAATVLGVLAAMVRGRDGLVAFDPRISQWAADNASVTATAVMRVATDLGSTATVIVATVVIGLVEWRRRPTRWLPLFLIVVVVGQNVLANVVKLAVDRARPALDPLTAFSGTSFPSGHSTAAAACFLAWALVLGRGRSRRTRALLAAAAIGGAVAVAESRVFLGVHWFTDALAGLLLGWSWFAVCSLAFGGRRLQLGEPIKVAEQTAVAAS